MQKHRFPFSYALDFGAARSGVGSVNLLRHYNLGVTLLDEKAPKEFRSLVRCLRRQGVTWHFGKDWTRKIFERVEVLIISPGIPLTHPLVREAQSRGIPVMSEVELAWYFTNAPILAITGTNGKTTTTTITGQMLTNSGYNAIVAGNIGHAFSNAVLSSVQEVRSEKPVLVTEISSFQLESIKRFRPQGAALLNISRDHLDRYPSMREYIEAKYRITMNQGPEDFLILNADDPFCMRLGEISRARLYFFSARHPVEQGAYVENGTIFLRDGGQTLPVCAATDVPIPGMHNMENCLVSLIFCHKMGVSAERMATSLRKFKGVEHRTEFIARHKGVSYYNDSKATNVDSLEKALLSFDSPIVLVAGGRDKRCSFDRLSPLVKQRVKTLVLIGEAAEIIDRAWGKLVPTQRASSLEDAVDKAARAACEGDVVILSPACASFDMFKNYEERGIAFKSCVQKWIKAHRA